MPLRMIKNIFLNRSSAQASTVSKVSKTVIENHRYLEFDLEIHRKNMKRNISMTIKPLKPIRIVTGKTVPLRRIEEFIFEKRKWIMKHQAKFSEVANEYLKNDLSEGDQYLFLGAKKTFRVSPTLLKKSFVAIEGDFLQLYFPTNEWSAHLKQKNHLDSRDLVLKFYRREAEKIILQRFQHWVAKSGLKPAGISFRNQKTRWGSCSSKGRINFNWRLVGAPIDVIDYVIVHELCHLEYMNHSDNFWSLVGMIYPNYQQAEQWLKQHHYALEFLS